MASPSGRESCLIAAVDGSVQDPRIGFRSSCRLESVIGQRPSGIGTPLVGGSTPAAIEQIAVNSILYGHLASSSIYLSCEPVWWQALPPTSEAT